MASDGVWEFISNDEIAAIVKPFYENKNAEKAAEAVVRIILEMEKGRGRNSR